MAKQLVVPDSPTPCMDDAEDKWFSNLKATRALAAQECLACPFRNECITQALSNGEQYGVWGGFDLQGKRH